MNTPLRAAIIGSGFMASVHARAIRDSGNELFAVASSSSTSAQKFATEFGVPNVFESWQDLVSSPEVEVVHICTPNELHAEIAIAAARAGKHVVSEKPISVSLAEAHAVRDEVLAHGKGFAVPFAYRFYPTVRELRARVLNGEAGQVHLIHGNYLQDWLAEPDSTNWRVDSASGGASRAFADVGTHWCDLMEFVSGDRITRLIANTSKAYEQRAGKKVQTEDIATVLFETENGASGSVTVSQVSFGRKNQLLIELDGSKASYTFNQELPDSLLVGGKRSSQIISHGQDSLQYSDSKRFSRVPAGHPQGYQDAFNSFMADVYDGFAGIAHVGVPGIEDGVRSAELIQAVLVSAAEKRWVDVPSFENKLIATAIAN
jgi:predicted dehydrogenase